MSTEVVAEIRRLLETTDGQAQERNSRLKLVKESRAIADEILRAHGEKTPLIEVEIGGKKGNIFLERSRSPLTEERTTGENLWIYFEGAGRVPIERPLSSLFCLSAYSVSSPEGELKTPAQFAGLKKVLGFIKTSLESFTKTS